MIMNRRNLILAAGGLVAFPFAARADESRIQGRDVEISPTTLALRGPGDTTICTVLNNGTAQTRSQIRLKAWHQVAGQDVLVDTDDIVASPPFMTVDPGQQQLVRIANLGATPGETEQAYRLLLDELPAPGALTGVGIQVLLEFSVPLFVFGEDASPARLTASFAESSGGIVIRFTNDGDVHARLSNVSYTTSAGATPVRIPGLAGYVLPRATKDLGTTLRGLPPAGGRLLAQTQLTASPVPILMRGD
jgi:fimbrial chaperone protein